MNISLDPRANYKTQSAAYDRLLLGKPLSSRKIGEYARAGRYGPELQARFAIHKPVPRVRKPSIDELLASL